MTEEERVEAYWQQNARQGAKNATGWAPDRKLTPRQRRRIDHKARHQSIQRAGR